MSTLVWGFCGAIGGQIVQEIGRREIPIRAWISDQPGARNIWDFLLGKVPAVRKDPAALGAYEEFYREHFETYHVMIARRGLYYADLHEVINEFSLAYHFFSQLLRREAIELAVFANMPHEGPDFILYNLARRQGIRTLICYQTLFADKFFLVTCAEDLGRFATTPALFDDGGIVLQPGYRQQSVNMEGLLPPESDAGPAAASGPPGPSAAAPARRVRALQNPLRSSRDLMKRLLVANSEPNLRRAYERHMREHALDEEKVVSLLARHDKVAYFPLHLQPELTTSAFGGIYQDQLYAIELLSSALDESWLILVKENPKQTFFQRRGLFFKRLASLQNVRLVNSAFSTYELIGKARFVATISGTACWEAIKGGKQSLVFGRTWYSGLPGVHAWGAGRDFPAFLESTRHAVPFQELQAAFAVLMSKAGPGVVDKDYACLVPDFDPAANARKVADSISAVLRSSKTLWT